MDGLSRLERMLAEGDMREEHDGNKLWGLGATLWTELSDALVNVAPELIQVARMARRACEKITDDEGLCLICDGVDSDGCPLAQVHDALAALARKLDGLPNV